MELTAPLLSPPSVSLWGAVLQHSVFEKIPDIIKQPQIDSLARNCWPLSDTISPLPSCSSLYSPHSVKMFLFQLQLSELLNLEKPWTLIIDDAMASSFVSPTTDAIEDDTRLIVEEYLRTWEQNEELGLNDMDTSTADNAYNTSTN